MIRDDAKRALLLQMDLAVQALAAELGQGRQQVISLTGIYHNMLRMWAEI
jgi:PKHD-type hydroxylase